jgi:hypothetical protein
MDTDEQQIRALIERGVRAVQAGDLDASSPTTPTTC